MRTELRRSRGFYLSPRSTISARSPAGSTCSSATVTGSVARNDRGRLRLSGIDVDLKLTGISGERSRLERCFGLFEDYCVVTQAVRDGIPVGVRVLDEEGTVLHVESTQTIPA